MQKVSILNAQTKYDETLGTNPHQKGKKKNWDRRT